MLYKWKFCILLLSMVFSNTAFSAVCEKLFHKLDKQDVAITDKDHQQKFIQLENDLFSAITKCRTYAGMFVLMGELQIEMGQVPLAVVYGQKSVEVDGGYWRAHKLLGSAKMLNKDVESGLFSLKKAVTLNPTNINTQLNLISALIQNENHDQALTLINTVIDQNEKDSLAIAYYFRSQVYKGKGLLIKAEKDAGIAEGLGFTLEQR